jgi:hypothetical protein
MTRIKGLYWWIPTVKILEAFECGEVVEDMFPSSDWNLKVGDVLEYRFGVDYYGTAEVVSVAGTTCSLKKLS